MAKLACEEAADTLKNVYWLTSNPEVAEQRADLDKRLRSEARELRRLRKLIEIAVKVWPSTKDIDALDREAERIQKARKK